MAGIYRKNKSSMHKVNVKLMFDTVTQSHQNLNRSYLKSQSNVCDTSKSQANDLT